MGLLKMVNSMTETDGFLGSVYHKGRESIILKDCVEAKKQKNTTSLMVMFLLQMPSLNFHVRFQACKSASQPGGSSCPT